MMETARDYEIKIPRIEGLTPSEAIPVLFGTIKECLELLSCFREENKALKEENTTLKAEIGELKIEVKELKSRLNMDSHNSSKPPSSDGFKKKTKSLRSHSGKTSGGQPGHPGNSLKCESPNETENLPVDECKRCKYSLKDQVLSDEEIAQIIDILFPKLFVKELRAAIKICPCCGMINKASLPSGIQAGIQYGAGVKSFMVYLNQYQHIPYERACEIFYEIFRHSISEGTLYNSIEECAASLEDFEIQLKGFLRRAWVIHCDETGVRVKNEREWLHVASTSDLAYYFLHARRGKEAMDAMDILPSFTGTAVHDFWGAYRKYPCSHSFCNGHLLRELIFAQDEDHSEHAGTMIECLMEIKGCVDEAKAYGAGCLPQEKLKYLQNRYDEIVREWNTCYPQETVKSGKRGRTKQSKTKNLLDRLSANYREVLKFMYDFSVPFDNNLAERDLRMMKLKEKISGTFRSNEGADYFCRIRSYIQTVKKNGLNVIEALKNAFHGKPFMPQVMIPSE
jgi:transposase